MLAITTAQAHVALFVAFIVGDVGLCVLFVALTKRSDRRITAVYSAIVERLPRTLENLKDAKEQMDALEAQVHKGSVPESPT